MALAPADQRRLLQLILLASSPFDGEALAALRKAQSIAISGRMTLPEALATVPAAKIDLRRIETLERDAYQRGFEDGKAEGARSAGPSSWPALAALCLDDHWRLLNAWETEFLESFIEHARTRIIPTPKQRAVFERIAARCGIATP